MTIEKNSLYEFAGELTMCWSDIQHAGIFETSQATAIVNRMRRNIHEQISDVMTQDSGLSVEQINTIVERIMERL